MIVQWATLAGILGVLGSLIITSWQTRMLVKQTRLKVSSAVVQADHGPASMLQNVLILFVQHPELRPYFFDSKPVPENEPERSRVKATADLFADAIYAGLHTGLLLPGDGVHQAWCTYATDVLRTSPALRALWAEHSNWWPPDLADMLDVTGCVGAPIDAAGRSEVGSRPNAPVDSRSRVPAVSASGAEPPAAAS
ncbi:hypothetical protein OHA21_25730 [Actinoplanes sp. NBC_00393]|uniref:hypothetical protein n=1 Tax=Actinoplanes sp. NBC_00393 TaxID=2975953 RepID=UPI002E1E2B4C